METLILISCLVICYYTGSTIEKKHYENIKAREAALSKTLCMTYGKAFSRSTKIKNSYLVSSSVVIGCDYFKSFLAGLRNLFGGNVSAYESVLDPAFSLHPDRSCSGRRKRENSLFPYDRSRGCFDLHRGKSGLF